MTSLSELAKEINDIAIEKGFWPEKRNKGEQVMLIVSELSEATEADRKGLWWKNTPKEAWGANMRNTVEDEIADTAIRILDFIYGWKMIVNIEPRNFPWQNNFGANMLTLTRFISNCSYADESRWNWALALLFDIARHYGFDLEMHIKEKIKYNKNRPAKHGKAY